MTNGNVADDIVIVTLYNIFVLMKKQNDHT